MVLKDVSFLNRNFFQPIALLYDVVARNKEFFDNLFVEKEMARKFLTIQASLLPLWLQGPEPEV